MNVIVPALKCLKCITMLGRKSSESTEERKVSSDEGHVLEADLEEF